jgi:hypothetical protein
MVRLYRHGGNGTGVILSPLGVVREEHVPCRARLPSRGKSIERCDTFEEPPPLPPHGTPCRHCGMAPVNRPRGLCWHCWHDADVRALYPPSASKFARRGNGCGHGGYQLPEPTDALPGSEEKIRVLEERARRREQLFHPLDAM